jgi:hypothetical protein
MDTAGVALVGLGHGDMQAQVRFTTADTADVDITAVDNAIIGMRLTCAVDDVDGAFDLSGDNFLLANNLIDCGSALGYENFLTIADGTNDFSMIGNFAQLGLDDDGESLIFSEGTHYNMQFINNVIYGPFSTSALDLDDDALTGTILFMNNVIWNQTAAADYCVEINAGTPGLFVNERYATAGEPANAPVTDLTASHCVDCHGTELANVSSLVFPKTVTAWA